MKTFRKYEVYRWYSNYELINLAYLHFISSLITPTLIVSLSFYSAILKNVNRRLISRRTFTAHVRLELINGLVSAIVSCKG